MIDLPGIDIQGPQTRRTTDVLTPAALDFVAALQRQFNPTRMRLLEARAERKPRLEGGEQPGFLSETRAVREGAWQVAQAPADLQDRRVEITGPVERKMLINALNSGARVFMADFEDANSPTWENVVEGQGNLIDATLGTIEFQNPDGRIYRLNDSVATLVVRPRGWHLVEKHVQVDGEPISASLFDFGLYLFHNGRRLLDKGSGPYFYLPKLESHREARLWNDVFVAAQASLGIPRGSIRATVLIETILAALEMEEILYELREHSSGLNAGRWDYIFSIIKKLPARSETVFPDRAQITMTVPFMRAYTELLVKTCHRRGAHAIGGMAAFVPSRRDPQVNEIALSKVEEDKRREAGDGFDGTWVAHPDLVPTATAVFDAVLAERPNQVSRQRQEVAVSAVQLLDVRVPDGAVTEAGLRNNISVAVQYLESWLRGVGAVAIYNLMEDAATAEIARSQIWQWIQQGMRLAEGQSIDRELVLRLEAEELEKIRQAIGDDAYTRGRFADACTLFERVALDPAFVEFLTLPAYDYLD